MLQLWDVGVGCGFVGGLCYAPLSFFTPLEVIGLRGYTMWGERTSCKQGYGSDD